MLFAAAHAVQLEDGSYAVRSSEFPGCEARSSRVELAREQFGDVLRDRLLAMIAAGEVPPLYTYEELAPSLPARCAMQSAAPDRRPGTFDRVMAVRPKLPPEAAERIEAMRMASQRERPKGDSEPLPGAETESRPGDTSGAAEHQRLGPSARLALAAARMAGRDRHVG